MVINLGKLVSTIILDWKEISDAAVVKLQRSLAAFDLYLGDAEKEYYGKAMSDTYTLYIAKHILGRRQLKKMLNENQQSKSKKQPMKRK